MGRGKTTAWPLVGVVPEDGRGEYLVRLRCFGHPAAGARVSPVVDLGLAPPAAGGAVTPPAAARALVLDLAQTGPAGTAVEVEACGGKPRT